MFKGVEAFSGLDVPDTDRFVIAPRRQVLVVRTEVQAGHLPPAVATCQLHCNGHERPVPVAQATLCGRPRYLVTGLMSTLYALPLLPLL